MEATLKLKQAVRSYKEGKAEAFTPLYEESSKYVYTCIYKVMNGNDNAQDIISDMMQDTYVEISKSIAQLDNEERFLQWAGIIATRKCYAYLKKNKKYVLLNEEDNTFDNLSDSESIIPEEVMQDREKQRLVREIIDTQLTEMQKLCIIAYYYNEQKQSEIAKELGIPENTVKTNLSRAKARIKDGVLDLEKNKGTKLYSVAPFLLLLFREDVQAAMVPKAVTSSVMSAASISAVSASASAGAGSTGATSLFGKIAAASVKAKIIGAAVAVGVTGVIGGTMFKTDKQDDSWESKYKGYLLSEENVDGFDLNDFDGDGEPELIVYDEQHKGISLYGNRLKSGITTDNTAGSITHDNDVYGYVDDKFVIIGIQKWDTDNGVYETPYYYQYEYNNHKFERTESLIAGYTTMVNTGEVTLHYKETEKGGTQEEVVTEDAVNRINSIWLQMTPVEFTEIEEEAIDERIEEFKKNGNRPAKGNANADALQIVEPEWEIATQEQEVEVSAEEQEAFRILAQFLTATRWGENLSGQEIVPNKQNTCDFIGWLSNENFEYNGWQYDKYLPARIAQDTYPKAFSEQEIKAYVKNVFGIELGAITSNWLQQSDGLYIPMDAQYSSSDKCIIEKVSAKGNTYTVTGTDAFGEYPDIDSTEPVYIANYRFTMILEKSENSPFGYVVKSISYTEAELSGEDRESAAQNLLADILLYPSQHMEYYPAEADVSNMWFALADINGDGREEVLLGDDYSFESPNRIINILAVTENGVEDLNGQDVYGRLQEWELYDNGILKTELGMGDNDTYFWNLNTREMWEAYTGIMAPGGSTAEDRTGVKFVQTPEHREIEGEEAVSLLRELSSGTPMPIQWYQTTAENVAAYIR